MNAVELTQKLVSFQSINPPGNESEAIEFIRQWLLKLGFEVQVFEFGKQRANLVARFGSQQSPVCLSGHIDVVPLGAAPWTKDPFAANVENGRLYGRGSCDMKGGIAAFLIATRELIQNAQALKDGLLIIITGGEETGCTGARALTEQMSPMNCKLLVIPEPTGNQAVIAHKGVAWLRLVAKGKTAHGSMPSQGVNAILKMSRALLALEVAPLPGIPHPLLGPATMNVGVITGGQNTNSVADRCWANVDFRLTPNCSSKDIKDWLGQTAPYVEVEQVLAECPSIFSNPHDPTLAQVLTGLHNAGLIHEPNGKVIHEAPCAGHVHTGYDPANDVTSAVYFTDASVLKAWLNDAPTLIIGPGDGVMAHQTDEFVEIGKLEHSVNIFRAMLQQQCL